MPFDPELFLARYAESYNARDPEGLRSFFALEDPRFSVFEDYSEKLFDGQAYDLVLEGTFDAAGEMSFELLRCDTFGEFATVHAIEKLAGTDEEGGAAEILIRATLLVSLASGKSRIVSAHFSALPAAETSSCCPGGCGM